MQAERLELEEHWPAQELGVRIEMPRDDARIGESIGRDEGSPAPEGPSLFGQTRRFARDQCFRAVLSKAMRPVHRGLRNAWIGRAIPELGETLLEFSRRPAATHAP